MKRGKQGRPAGLTGAVRTAASYKKFIAVLILAGGCSTTPAPTSELAAARNAVAQAQAAALDAPGVLASAQDKLARAEQAMQRGEHLHARLFAEQAEADARLATATAENARARR